MIEARQIRAARALLDWTRDDLARASGLSVPALTQIEGAHRVARSSSMDKIRAALEAAGVVFTDSMGVKMRSDTLQVYEGLEGFNNFFDDVYLSLKNSAQPRVFVSGVERDRFVAGRSEQSVSQHRARMEAIEGLDFRVISSEHEEPHVQKEDYVKYRVIDQARFYPLPIYGYAGKLGIITWEPHLKVIVIANGDVYQAFSIFFDLLWQRARDMK